MMREESCQIWLNPSDAAKIKSKVITNLDGISDDNLDTVFILYTAIIALFSTKFEAKLDQTKLLFLIQKLTNNQSVDKSTAVALIGNRFIALVGVILECLSTRLTLPKGRQVARENSATLMGRAMRLARKRIELNAASSDNYQGLNSNNIYQFIKRKYHNRFSCKENGETINNLPLIVEESCPEMNAI